MSREKEVLGEDILGFYDYSDVPGYDSHLNEVCPNCSRKINNRVSKCVCGMEFKI